MLDLLILVLCLGGFAINLLLLIRGFGNGAGFIAGCGGGSACENVLTSRWSQVFGIPLTVFGMLVYAALMHSLTPRGHRSLAPLLGLVAGSAVWLIFVQLVFLKTFCPWCMAAHGIAVAVFVLGARRLVCWDSFGITVRNLTTFSALGFFAIALLQLYGPKPDTHRIDPVAMPVRVDEGDVHARGAGRKVTFADGTRSYNVSLLPHIGPTDAKNVLVEYFDYQCPACRTMRGHISALMDKYPKEICVVLLPVPLDGKCNLELKPLDEGHPGSCELSRLSLAVWKENPAEFAKFHEEILAGASIETARHDAAALVPERLDAALADPWVGDIIQSNISDWKDFSQKTNHLPKLLITGHRILHGLPSGTEDFIRVMEQELKLKP